MEFGELEEMMAYEGRQFITDGEGPVTKNDNAYELCREYIENGDRFFSIVSKYDDVLADVFHRKNYKAGDTLRLILPFLKAYGLTDSLMLDFSSKNILLVPGARKTMRFVNDMMPSFIVSTSFEHYVSAVCDAIGFPFNHAYCTQANLDICRIEEWERNVLKSYAQEIARMPMISIPDGASAVSDFRPTDRDTIRRLDDIFWEEMTDLSSYELILQVNPVGGEEKANSILDVRRRTGIELEDTMYIGDSITDAQALQLVREGGGLTVSFNGNAYAIREAEIAVMAPDTVVTSVLAEAFDRAGKEGVMALVDGWEKESLRKSSLAHDYLLRELERVFPDGLPTVRRITPENRLELSERSSRFRKTVRGDSVGSLG